MIWGRDPTPKRRVWLRSLGLRLPSRRLRGPWSGGCAPLGLNTGAMTGPKDQLRVAPPNISPQNIGEGPDPTPDGSSLPKPQLRGTLPSGSTSPIRHPRPLAAKGRVGRFSADPLWAAVAHEMICDLCRRPGVRARSWHVGAFPVNWRRTGGPEVSHPCAAKIHQQIPSPPARLVLCRRGDSPIAFRQGKTLAPELR